MPPVPAPSMAKVLALIAITLSALAFGLLASANLHRVQRLSASPDWSVDSPVRSSSSATGYEGGQRVLYVPNANSESMQTIAQTQQLLQDNVWLQRTYSYDNAPFGRESHLPVLYRTLHAVCASVHHQITGDPLGISVEWSALHLDCALWLSALVLLSTLAWRWFGFTSAAGLALTFTLFPWVTAPVPGAPEHQSLTYLAATFASLALLAGISGTPAPRSRATRFIAAGLALGLVCSLDVPIGLTLALALFSGACLLQHRRPHTYPWRLWATPAALICGFTFVAEHLHSVSYWRLDHAHPAWSIMLLGLGEILRSQTLLERGAKTRRIACTVGICIASVPFVFAIVTGRLDIWITDLSRFRLASNYEGGTATNLGHWLRLEGVSLRVITLAITALLVGIVLCRRSQSENDRPGRIIAAFLTITPALIGCVFLRWWNLFDATVAASIACLLRSGVKDVKARRGIVEFSLLGAASALSLILVGTPLFRARTDELSASEARQLQSRDFSHWLAKLSPQAVVLAPPALTQSLIFHGGLRGVGTLDADNREGFLAASTLATALSFPEAQALLDKREITHVAFPFWDRALESAWKAETPSTRPIFFEQIRQWILPPFLRPIAYAGEPPETTEAERTVLFERVQEQPDAALATHLSLYFVESGLLEHANAIKGYLSRFPNDLSCRVALAQIASSQGDLESFGKLASSLATRAKTAPARALDWVHRVNLAAVLSQAGSSAEATELTQGCLAELAQTGIPATSARSLFRFQALCGKHSIQIPDTLRRELEARMPPEYRSASSSR